MGKMSYFCSLHRASPNQKKVASVAECTTACRENELCEAVTYTKNWNGVGNCWMKTRDACENPTDNFSDQYEVVTSAFYQRK